MWSISETKLHRHARYFFPCIDKATGDMPLCCSHSSLKTYFSTFYDTTQRNTHLTYYGHTTQHNAQYLSPFPSGSPSKPPASLQVSNLWLRLPPLPQRQFRCAPNHEQQHLRGTYRRSAAAVSTTTLRLHSFLSMDTSYPNTMPSNK